MNDKLVERVKWHLTFRVVRTKLVRDRTVQRIMFHISMDDLTVAQYNDGIAVQCSVGFNSNIPNALSPATKHRLANLLLTRGAQM